jgi:hypothetical protein
VIDEEMLITFCVEFEVPKRGAPSPERPWSPFKDAPDD